MRHSFLPALLMPMGSIPALIDVAATMRKTAYGRFREKCNEHGSQRMAQIEACYAQVLEMPA